MILKIRANKRLLSLSIMIILLLFAASSSFSQIKKGKRFSKKNNCIDCHEVSDFKGNVKHAPFEKKECRACHKPHGIVGVLRLKETGAKLCESCHAGESIGLDKQFVHKPAADGKCYTCHDPFKANACDACHENNGSDGGSEQ